jgi:hypothetical protein
MEHYGVDSEQDVDYFTLALAFRRSAQYFFIRSETALRATADIVSVFTDLSAAES